MKLLSKIKIITMAGLVISLGIGSSNASTNTVLGIDVSSYQGQINWSSVRSCGALFAFAKASEGVTYQDPDFHTYMANGKAAGVFMGAYHFAHPDVNCPAAEANYFWSAAGSQIIADGKSLYPAIDFEVFNGHACQPSYTAWVNAWASDVKAKTSHFLRPVLAIDPCAGACNFATNCTLQIWGLGGTPWSSCSCCNFANPCTKKGWAYWLISPNGSICGVSGSVDLDEYNGDLASLKANEVVK